MSTPKKKACDENNVTAVGLLRFAKEYHQTGRDALDAYRSRQPENQRHHTLVPFPIYFNFLHAIELSLKAFMRHHGASMDELKSPKGVGHNLSLALEKCIEKDLLNSGVELSQVSIDTIKHASEMYQKKEFEYIRIGPVELGHIDQISAASTQLVEGIESVLHPPRQS